MNEIELPPVPPAGDPARLDRLEARVAMLEAKLAAAEAEADLPGAAPATTGNNLADWVRNNPVMAVIAAIVLLILLGHLLD